MCRCEFPSTLRSTESPISESCQSSSTRSILNQHPDNHDVPAFFKPQHHRPRTVAFGSRADRIFSAIPKSVGRYDYRFDFPELEIQDLFCGHIDIAFIFRDVLRGIFGADLDEIDEEDKRGFPLIDEFVAQMIIITNAPYIVISLTLTLLRQLRHKRRTPPIWMKEHEFFLATFAMACNMPATKPHITNLEFVLFGNLDYWESVTRIHYRNIEWMVLKVMDVIKGFDIEPHAMQFIEEAQYREGKEIIESHAPTVHFCTCSKIVPSRALGAYQLALSRNRQIEKLLRSGDCSNPRKRCYSPPPPVPSTFTTTSPFSSISWWFWWLVTTGKEDDECSYINRAFLERLTLVRQR